MNVRTPPRPGAGRWSGESGHALVVTALAVIAMMGFAAMAIDLGELYNARRQDQSAADTAALAAAQELGDDTETVLAAISLANSTLQTPLSTASYDTCGTEVLESWLIRAPGVDCVAWNTVRTKVRVRIPLQTLDSTFAQVVGVDEFEHSAYAMAAIEGEGFGDVLPIAVPSGAGTYECLKVGAGNVPDTNCSGSSEGNFRLVNLAFHRNEDLGTSLDCVGQGKDRVANNLAVGADHPLSIYGGEPHLSGGSPVQVIDTVSCGVVPRPNAFETVTGNVPNVTGAGLFSGTGFSDGGPARLQRTMLDADELTWGSTTTVGGFTLDDNPLWEFIGSDVDVTDDLPTSCLPGNFSNPASFVSADVWAHLSTMTYAQQMVRLLQRCFVHYTGDTWDDDGAFLFPEAPTGCGADLICTAPVFTRNSSSNDSPDLYDIQYTSRFAYIPQLTTGFPSGSSDPVNIARFRAVFLQRLYGGNCGGGGCDIQFDPGVGYSYASSESKASAVTGFLFPDSMLPGGLGGPTAPMDLNVNTFVRLIQ